jgi:predicted neutral ceramidase superfamily lipid hydrolase
MALMIIASIILLFLGENNTADYIYSYRGLIIPIIVWVIWSIIFYRNYKTDNPSAFISNITSWLLRGSILELVVAVPSHIISRNREECCAPPLTLVGIITGIAIALMAFGPGLFFLYAKRIKDKEGKK